MRSCGRHVGQIVVVAIEDVANDEGETILDGDLAHPEAVSAVAPFACHVSCAALSSVRIPDWLWAVIIVRSRRPPPFAFRLQVSYQTQGPPSELLRPY